MNCTKVRRVPLETLETVVVYMEGDSREGQGYRYLVRHWEHKNVSIPQKRWDEIEKKTRRDSLTSQWLPAQRPVTRQHPRRRKGTCKKEKQSQGSKDSIAQQSAQSALTFEQQPPKIRASMPPAASHCGMVSMMMRPARAMKRW